MTLTKRQKECLSFIEEYIESYGHSPSIRDICSGLNIASPSAALKILNTLEKKGYIKRSKNLSRAIELIRKKNALPILGKITAGIPISAEENIEGYIVIDEILGPSLEDYFCLRIVGDSMIEKGIMDGDIAVIRKQPTISNNQIGAFMINGEFTLKTFKVDQNGKIYLKPENSRYKPIYININDTDQFEVVGLLKMIIRSYGDQYETENTEITVAAVFKKGFIDPKWFLVDNKKSVDHKDYLSLE